MTDLQRRNAAAMVQTVELFRKELEEFRGELKALRAQVSMQQVENQTLRQMIVTSLVARGHGPTAG